MFFFLLNLALLFVFMLKVKVESVDILNLECFHDVLVLILR
jgi:hypothetical protein